MQRSSPARLAYQLSRWPLNVDTVRVLFRDNAGREERVVMEWPGARLVAAQDGGDKGCNAFADEIHDLLQDDCDSLDVPAHYVIQGVREARPVCTHRMRFIPATRDAEEDALLKPPEEASPTGLVGQLMRHLEIRDRALLGSLSTTQRINIEMLDRLGARLEASDKRIDALDRERLDLWMTMRKLLEGREDYDLRKEEQERNSKRWDRLLKPVEEIVIPMAADKILGSGSAPAGDAHGNGSNGKNGAATWADVARAAVNAATSNNEGS